MGLPNDIPQCVAGLVWNALSTSINLSHTIDQRQMALGVYLIASEKSFGPFGHFHTVGISNTKHKTPKI